MVDEQKNIPDILEDRKLFEELVYTPLDEAIKELRLRENDLGLSKKITEITKGEIPKPLLDGPAAVLFRQVATPNYETRRFVSIAKKIGGMGIIFWEYYQDKFTSNNEWKHSLGKIRFYNGMGKKHGLKVDRVNVIDFNKSVGKKISEVKTLWRQPIVGFHHEFFKKTYGNVEGSNFFDASNWFAFHGGSAGNYYTPFLSLFIKNGILFENFMLDTKEISFTRDIFLPAFFEVIRLTGKKPLIVALETPDTETNEFWLCHPGSGRGFVDGKLRKRQVFSYPKFLIWNLFKKHPR